jgi:phenylalanyl-tRNA synthetase beta chain
MKNDIKTYNEYSKYPSITRDLSLMFDKKISFSDVKIKIQDEVNYLKSVNFFDIYFDRDNLETVNLGIRLEFQVQDRTLTANEIDHEIITLEKSLIEMYKVEIRN